MGNLVQRVPLIGERGFPDCGGLVCWDSNTAALEAARRLGAPNLCPCSWAWYCGRLGAEVGARLGAGGGRRAGASSTETGTQLLPLLPRRSEDSEPTEPGHQGAIPEWAGLVLGPQTRLHPIRLMDSGGSHPQRTPQHSQCVSSLRTSDRAGLTRASSGGNDRASTRDPSLPMNPQALTLLSRVRCWRGLPSAECH